MSFGNQFRRLAFAALGLLCTNVHASCGPPDSLTVLSHDFSAQSLNTITDIAIANPFNGLQVGLSGGYITQDAQTYAWQLAPAGDSEAGESAGEASILFEPDARYVNASFSVPEGTFLRLQLFNNLGSLLKEYSVDSESQYEFESPENRITEADIAELKLIIDGGDEPVTMSAIYFSTPQTVCTESVSTGGSIDWLAYLGIGVLLLAHRRSRRR